jgi:glycosyltransferase involved in cell wall biosynthesis
MTPVKAPKLMLATPYYAPKVGGLENYAHRIAQELISRGWEVIAVASNHESGKESTDIVDGVRVYRLPASFKLSNTQFNPGWAGRIRQIIKDEQPDIIVGHAPVPGIADAAARAAGDIPFVLTYHAATLYKQKSLLFNTVILGYRLVEKLMLNKTIQIVTVTPYHKDRISAKNRAKFHLIENAIPESELLAVRPVKKPHRLIFINNLAKAHSWKGLDQVLEAIAIYAKTGKPVHLDVIGGGDYLEHYKQMAEQLGITKHVTFYGEQTGDAKNVPLSQAAALLCYPKTANDAFPTVMIEAWAHYTPVIAAKIGALPHIVRDGENSMLAEANNPADLAKVIGKVLEDEKLQRKLADGGFARASELTWTKQGAKTDKLLQRLIK